MSSDENTPDHTNVVTLKCQGALQLGPRKKPYALKFEHLLWPITDHYIPVITVLAAWQIPSSTLEGILDVLYMHYVPSVQSWTTGSCWSEANGWNFNSWVRAHYLSFESADYWVFYARDAQEQGVFKQLLHMIPGLEDHLTKGSEEEIEHIAQLVRGLLINFILRSSMCSDTERCLYCQIRRH